MFQKIKFCFFTILVFLLTTFFVSQNIRAQQNGNSKPALNPQIESLRRQIEEQKAEIQTLQNELKEESDLRKQQQKTLEALIERLEKFDSVVVSLTKPNEEKSAGIVNAALQNPPQSSPEQKQAKTSDEAVQTDTKKQTDKAPTVEAGFGKIKINGVLQGWYAAGDRGYVNTFRIRRAEVRLTGALLPKVKWSVMFDLAKTLSLNNSSANINGNSVLTNVSVNQSSRIFQEAFITLSYFKRANLQIGQFKLPVSLEGTQSSATLDTVEKALFLSDRARSGALGDVRDIGMMAFGALNKQMDYQVGVFNGTGETQNNVGRNQQKAIAGRLIFHPTSVKGLQFGSSGVLSSDVNSLNPRRDRFGVEFVYDRRPFKFKSEFMTGIDGDIHRRGFYAHVGYRFFQKLEGIFRFDTFDPDIRQENNSLNVTERDYIGGLNYYIKENNLKLQVNYLHKTFAGGISPARNLILVNLQTAW